MFGLKFFGLVMEKGCESAGWDHCGLWRWVALSFSKGLQTHSANTRTPVYFLTSSYVRETTRLGAGSCFFFSSRGTSTLPFLTQWQSVVVNGSIQYSKSLNSLLVGLNVIVQALHTNTSSVRSCLLQHLFIDCLMTLYDWIGIADTQTEQGDIFKDEEKKDFFWTEEHFLVCFYIPWELPSPNYLGSQSQLWAFFWSEEMQIEEWKQKKKENWARKERKERLNSVLRDIT